MALSPGIRLGPYEIVGRIGAGGMGEVWKARDPKLGRFVAIKILPEAFAEDADRLRRFEQEANVLAALNHPNLVQIFEAGEHEGVSFLVMELLEGETLREKLGGKPLAPKRAAEIAREAALGLAAAHEKGILHRDLKPENLWITKDGRLKILDFGLAKQVPVIGKGGQTEAPTQDFRHATEAGIVLGTVGYLSPEQVRSGPVDGRSDIFSLGVVLYEMVGGARPFTGDTAIQVMSAILQEEPPELKSAKGPLPAALGRIVHHCLEKAPEERFQSARDLAFDLLTVAGSGVPGEPLAVATANGRPWRLLAAAVVAFLGVAFAGLYWTGGRARPAPILDSDKVLVMTFTNQTGDPSLDSVGRLAASRVAAGIQQTGAVKSAQASEPEPRGNEGVRSVRPLEAAARVSGSGLVVSGEYYLEGQNLRFESRLTYLTPIQTSCPFDSAMASRTEPSLAMTAIAQQAMGAFTLRALDQVLDPRLMSRIPTYQAAKECVAAYELYGSDYRRSIPHYQRAAELDPEFFFPRHQLAFAYGNIGDLKAMGREIQSLDVRRNSFSALERRRLDEVVAIRQGRNEEDRSAVRAGLQLAPASLWLHARLGSAARRTNRLRESVEALTAPMPWERILNSNYPFYVNYFQVLTGALHLLGDHERELAEARRGESVYPDLLAARACEVPALAALGRTDEVVHVVEVGLAMSSRIGTPADMMREATEELRAHGQFGASLSLARRATTWLRTQPNARQKGETNRAQLTAFLCLAEHFEEARTMAVAMVREHPNDVDHLGLLGTLEARRGDLPEAARISNSLKASAKTELKGRHTLWRARIAALSGDRSGAVELLREAFAQGYDYGIGFHRDMDLEPLHGYPPYEELMKPKD